MARVVDLQGKAVIRIKPQQGVRPQGRLRSLLRKLFRR
jgi:hypothetical protein